MKRGIITKNKKAVNFLGEHGLNLIIAALCLFILLLVGVSVYGLLWGNAAKLEQAKADLKNIMESVNSLNKEGDSSTLILYNPKEWFIYYVSKGINGPADCGGKDCLCICGGPFINDCNDPKKSACQIYTLHVLEVKSSDTSFGIKIENPIKINISLNKDKVSLTNIA